jgi:RecQ family ATP-dependent DNA helicase
MNIFQTYIERALEIKGDLQESRPRQKYGQIEVPLSALAPKSLRTRDGSWERRSRVVLDLLGIGFSINGKRVSLRWKEYYEGDLDKAMLLRDAFASKLFRRTEIVSFECFRNLCIGTKKAGRNPEEIFPLYLEEVGFKPLGKHRFLRGAERVMLEGDRVKFQWSMPIGLRLAKSSRFTYMKRVKSDHLLRKYFQKFESYKSQTQRNTIHALCAENGPSVVVSRMPTGGGKSLCYLLPSACAAQNGRPQTAIVVSPTIALQNDQVIKVRDTLNRVRGVNLQVDQINSTVSHEKRALIYKSLRQGKLHVLLLSPEKITDPFFRETLFALAEKKCIGFFVIDEAHIIPEWGRDFRTEFYRLGVIRKKLVERCPELKTLILSATLTDSKEEEVLRVLRIEEEPVRFTEPVIRRELSIRVLRFNDQKEKLKHLLRLAPHLPKPVIVYCSMRKHVKEIMREFKSNGIYRCLDYTGSTPREGREKRLEAFLGGDVNFVIATNAFGLGIDKENLRTVIHFDVPRNLDACYQEMGRAARDGKTGHSIIFYSPSGMRHATRTSRAILTEEKAWGRLSAMLKHKIHLGKNSAEALLPLHILPKYNKDREDNELNRKWNLASLNIMEEMNQVDIKGIVFRKVKIIKNRKRRFKEGRIPGLLDLLRRNKGGKNGFNLDLSRVAIKCKVPFENVFSEIIGLSQTGRISITSLDDKKGESWVLVELNKVSSWSSKDLWKLEELREKDLKEINDGIKQFRSFFHSNECRLSHFARFYGFEMDKPCGHCDRCDPGLLMSS